MDSTYFASIIGPFYLVMGLSILFYAREWKKVLAELSKDHLMMLSGMILSFIIGLILLNEYNVWSWDWNIIITITGWGALIKGIFYLLAPGSWTKDILKWHASLSEIWYYVLSVVMIVVGGIMTQISYLN